MVSGMNAPVGSLQQASTTEDRVLFVYRRDRRAVRGILEFVLALLLVVAGFALGIKLGTFWGWILALVPLFVGAVAANWGLADLLRPTLFQLEVDHRARTLALSMALVGGESLAKVRFEDATALEIARKGRTWNVTILLRDGRRVGLGLSDDPAKAEEVAGRFSGLVGIPIRRTPS
jgi:hypothetical protein